MKNLTKFIAAGILATLLVPALAFAHQDGVKTSLEVRLEKGIERAEKGDSHDQRHEERKGKQASTTAAVIVKKATRINASADTMLSFSTRIGTLIASLSADEQAALNAKFAGFTSDAASAKTSAAAALAGAAQINAGNSTTTNAALTAQAKLDLRLAHGFLQDAREALFSILRALWR